MKRILLVGLVIVLAVTVVGASVWAYLTFSYPGLFNSIGTSALPCPAGATGASGQTHFAIVISNQGLNGSKYSDSCPLIRVQKGQSVTIHFVNNDGEMHGIAITHFLGAGVQVRPGESREVTFTVDQTGSFTIYCNTGCFVHNYMQKGRLSVTD